MFTKNFEYNEHDFLNSPYEIPAVPHQFSFQEPATPVMNGLLDLHDYVFFFIIVILSVVITLLFQVVSTFSINTNKGKELSFFNNSSNLFLNFQISFFKNLSFLSFFIFFLFHFFINFFFWLISILKAFAQLTSSNFMKTWFLKKRKILNKNFSIVSSISGLPLLIIEKKKVNFFKTNFLYQYESTSVNDKFLVSSEKDNATGSVKNNFSNKKYNHIEQILSQPSNFFYKKQSLLLLPFILSNIFNLKASAEDKFFFSSKILSIFNLPKSFFHSSEYSKNNNLVSEEINVYDDEYFEFFLNSWFNYFGKTLKNSNEIISNKLKDNSDFFFFNDENIFLSNLFFEAGYLKHSFLFKNFDTYFNNLNSEDSDSIDFLALHSAETLDTILGEDYVYTYSDFLKNIDFLVSVYNVNDERYIKAITESLVDAELERKFLLDSNVILDKELNLSFPFSISNNKILSNLVFVEPMWFAFVLDESKNHILDYEDEEELDSNLNNINPEIENLLDIILANFVHHIFTSKYIQRITLLCNQFLEMFLFSLKNSGSFFSFPKSLFIKKIENDDEWEEKLDLLTGDFYINNFFSSRYIRLHKFLKIGYFNHSTRLEIIWTLIPIFIIALIITPSFFFMYAIDEDMEALLTIRVIGHQWFWSYAYSFPGYNYSANNSFFDENKDLSSLLEMKNYTFDSYMLDDNTKGAPRLLATDSVLVLPKYSHINCVVTSSDVIHSWAIPSLGVKIDAVPGRLNRVDVFIEHEGMFFGQCSEICGVNHAFMPIHVQAVSLSDFLRFMLETFQ